MNYTEKHAHMPESEAVIFSNICFATGKITLAMPPVAHWPLTTTASFFSLGEYIPEIYTQLYNRDIQHISLYNQLLYCIIFIAHTATFRNEKKPRSPPKPRCLSCRFVLIQSNARLVAMYWTWGRGGSTFLGGKKTGKKKWMTCWSGRQSEYTDKHWSFPWSQLPIFWADFQEIWEGGYRKPSWGL